MFVFCVCVMSTVMIQMTVWTSLSTEAALDVLACFLMEPGHKVPYVHTYHTFQPHKPSKDQIQHMC